MAKEAGNTALIALLHLGFGILRGVGLAYTDDYLSYTTEAARLAQELNDIELQSSVGSYLPWVHLTSGDLNSAREVIATVSENLPEGPDFGGPVSAIPAKPLLIMADAVRLTVSGQLPEALAQYKKTNALLEQTNFMDGVVYSDFRACNATVYMGDLASARQRSQALFEIAEISPIGVVPVAADIAAGIVACADGNFSLAIEFLERARKSLLDKRAFGLLRVPAEPFLVDALLQKGRPDEARALGEETLALCRDHHFKLTVDPWIAMARVHIQVGDQAKALALINEAQEILKETEAHTFAPFLCECRAEFAQAFACDWSAQSELQKAHDLFLEIGAPGNAQRIAQLS